MASENAASDCFRVVRLEELRRRRPAAFTVQSGAQLPVFALVCERGERRRPLDALDHLPAKVARSAIAERMLQVLTQKHAAAGRHLQRSANQCERDRGVQQILATSY